MAAAAIVAVGCKSGEHLTPDQEAATVSVSPQSARMWVVGDSVQFTVAVTTVSGANGSGLPVNWVSRNPSLVSVSSTGLVKTIKKGDSTYVVATVGDKSDSALVEVPMTPCGSVTRTAVTAGQVVTDIGATGFCAASVPGAEYTVIAFFNSLTSSATASFEVTGLGLSSAAASSSNASLALRVAFRSPTGLSLSTVPRKRDLRGEAAFRSAERIELAPRVAAAQAWYRGRGQRALRNSAPPAVGSEMTVNTSMSTSCSSRINHTARVAAVSNGAIILTDSTNPPGGFSDADYASIATTFDTLVAPVDTTTFGSPTDLDGNGRVIILFTRAVNELTPSQSDTYTAGRTMTRDLFPTTALVNDSRFSTTRSFPCDASNVGEIFYILAPDPTGVVNGNVFTAGFVDSVAVITIAHEYQHMINYSRRMYLLGLQPSQWADEIWLHEGLSHTAESLVFHEASGLPTRTNIGLPDLTNPTNDQAFNAFNLYMIGDFFLNDSYVGAVATTSPYHQGDPVDLSTRGAIWSFLRYAADQSGQTDGVGKANFFYRLVNSGLLGLTNLETQLGVTGAGMQAMVRDFAVSVYADDWVGVDPRFTQPSWNMRSIYAGFNDPTFYYPLLTTPLTENVASPQTVVAGGFAVFQFASQNGADAFVRAKGPGGSILPVGVTLSIIRTK